MQQPSLIRILTALSSKFSDSARYDKTASTSSCWNLSFICIPNTILPSLNCNLLSLTNMRIPRFIYFARIHGRSPYLEKCKTVPLPYKHFSMPRHISSALVRANTASTPYFLPIGIMDVLQYSHVIL